MLKLNLGCGHDLKTGYINIDIKPPCDQILDLSAPLPFAKNSVDEICAYSFICLFSQNDLEKMFRDWHQVLKTGGKLEIIEHSIIPIMQNFISSPNQERWTHWFERIWGNEHWGFAKNGFTFDKLESDLAHAGFSNFESNSTDELTIGLTCQKS